MSSFESQWPTIKTPDDAIKTHEDLNASKILFAIDFLDDALSGIRFNDLILLGAPSGGGKTQLATLIALNAIKQGKRVNMFALEAMKNEITLRLVHTSLDEPMSFSSFLFEQTKEVASELIRNSLAKIENAELLRVFYKEDTFGARELAKELNALENNTDLIIIDHFSFMDLPGEKQEFQEQRELVSEINRLQKTIKKPIIILAQFSKHATRGLKEQNFPTLTDFYGTSALTNLCTKAITIQNRLPENLSCDYRSNNPDHCSTVLHVAKNRFDGDRSHFFAVATFDRKKANYRGGYYLHEASTGSAVLALRTPKWATKAKAGTPYDN